MTSRTLMLLFASLLASAAPNIFAAEYPSKPVRVLVGYTPGGAVDSAARVLSEFLGRKFGQALIVENRPGADQIIALDIVAQSEPDGHTLIFAASSMSLAPAINKSFKFDLSKDFTPVATVVINRFAVAVPASSPYKTIEELVAGMKANPGKLNAGGSGATDTFAYEIFRSATGTKFQDIRYPGAARAAQGLLTGEIDLVLNLGLNVAKGIVDGNRARVLVVHGTARSVPFFPNVPAMGESILPELREFARNALTAGAWFGLLAPPRTPRSAVGTLHTAVREVTKDVEFRKRVLATSGAEAVESVPTPEEFAAMISRGAREAAMVAKKLGIQPQ